MSAFGHFPDAPDGWTERQILTSFRKFVPSDEKEQQAAHGLQPGLKTPSPKPMPNTSRVGVAWFV